MSGRATVAAHRPGGGAHTVERTPAFPGNHQAALRALTAAIGHTPVAAAHLTIGGVSHEILLKLESFNPTGSVKDRTALSLIRELYRRGQLGPGRRLIESSSGNLAVALGRLARLLGLPFTAVVDPKLTAENRAKLERYGVEIVMVSTPDSAGSFLDSRLARVAQCCAGDDRYVWANQYGSPANPQAHYLGTGPELWLQAGRRLDAVFIAASTGGTLAGIAGYLGTVDPGVTVVGVDTVGSVVFGGRPSTRCLVGIGSSRRPEFPVAELAGEVALVSGEQACRAVHLLRRAGLPLGGSSGCVLHAAAEYLARSRTPRRVAVVCPDTGDNYRSSLFSAAWLAAQGFDPVELMCTDRLRLPGGGEAFLSAPKLVDSGTEA